MKIHHIAITVNNLNESLKFYQDFFGFQLVKKFKKKEMKAEFALIKSGDYLIELWEFMDMKLNSDDLSDLKIRGIRHIAFAVENIDKVVSEFKNKGLDISEPKMGIAGHRFSFTNDPNGISLELYEI
ncbi:VOC family protein [Candidatus Parcubacteria bacterium]|nr:VOC family protein [Candidatus Parcubacteria bacterium]